MKKHIIWPANLAIEKYLMDNDFDFGREPRGINVKLVNRSSDDKKALLEFVNNNKSGIYSGVIKQAKEILDFMG